MDAARRREQAEADRRVLAAKEEALQVSQGYKSKSFTIYHGFYNHMTSCSGMTCPRVCV